MFEKRMKMFGIPIKKTSASSTEESSNVGLPRETRIDLHVKDFERKNCIGLSGKVC